MYTLSGSHIEKTQCADPPAEAAWLERALSGFLLWVVSMKGPFSESRSMLADLREASYVLCFVRESVL
jgi:hypothetical protein